VGALTGRAADLRGDEQRTVEPRPEAGRQQVVGLARRLGRLVGPRVGAPQPHPRERNRDDDEHDERGGREGMRTALDPVAPARPPARLDVVRLGCAGRLHSPPEEAEQRGQQRERADHRQRHRGRGRDRRPVEERDAEQQHAEQRDDDRRAGEQHRAPGRVHRGQRRLAHVGAGRAFAAEAVDHEQAVVDPYAQRDHDRERRCEVGDVERTGRRVHEAHGRSNRGEGGDQRHRHRGERAEDQHEHHDRGEHADQLGGAGRRLLGALDRLAAELHLQAGCGAGLGGVDDPLDVLLVQVDGLLVEEHRRVGGAPVAADRRAVARVGADGRRDTRLLGDPVHDALDLGAPRPVAQRPVDDVEHDPARVAGLLGEAVAQEVERAL
jgi:hypothetical protein